MLFKAEYIPYQQTGFFSKIVKDYLSQQETVAPFYAFAPTIEGFKKAIATKQNQKVDRALLVTELLKQYSLVKAQEAVLNNIQLLAQANTFTVCTAHQPNLFTGPLYFMYKILHAIKLAHYLKQQLPQFNFVPVYYMGSEDADFAELNHTYVSGKKIEWNKVQSGAVGRMVVDAQLISLIDELNGQLSVLPFGKEVIHLLKQCYAVGKNIQTATFELVNELYGKYGLVVLIPDNAALKATMQQVFEEDLFGQTPSSIVEETSAALATHYNVQAHPREINLFYLNNNIRERIIKKDEVFYVHGTSIEFTEEALREELTLHPERFSPNVILRGLFQETILPNIAFIGGGGELAYWLQLKPLFQHYNVVYPVLVLRNSFAVITHTCQKFINKLQLSNNELFLDTLHLLNLIIERENKKPDLSSEITQLKALYQQIQTVASNTDGTLLQHVEALQTKAVHLLHNLEKKMMRAERKKQEVAKNAIAQVKQQLFPNKGLQERVENFSSFYAQWGSSFIDELYNHSLSLEQQFILLKEVV